MTLKKTSSATKPDALPRTCALGILNEIDKTGMHADKAVAKGFSAPRNLSSREKAFVTELVYGVLRRRETLDWVIGRFSAHPHRRLSRVIRNLLRIGIYQILYLTAVPAPVSVSATVAMAKEHLGSRMGSVVNGLLRAVERNRTTIPFPSLNEDPITAIAVRYSHPVWMVKKWLPVLGEKETISLCEANNTVPPFTIRTNTLRITRDELTGHLRSEGISCEVTRHSPDGIMLRHPADITRLSSFQKGWFVVQDEAAQLIVYLVNPAAGERVLDLCAAPGGKTTHLAQLTGDRGGILAVDVRRDKTALLQENTRRLGIESVCPVIADAATPLPVTHGTSFDKVLVDAPCSGLGILRRHPEGKWFKSPALLSHLPNTQRAILRNASRYVKPGGVIVYSTCTMDQQENETIVEEFLSLAGGEFQVDRSLPAMPFPEKRFFDDQGYFHTSPLRDAMDGFFAVRLRRVGP
ncbi:MAG: 16S rRNA (cytosine(967)-C(5))-methyltransferase RsmB [Deltaproteobacteria bacterium]|nr:16S rRNA (cytosine(967)-C(5))-methyltransferase RsmB [Deltaproteobacteria bacterium]